jgi:hypothetical protein
MTLSESKPAASASESFVETSIAASELAMACRAARSARAGGDSPHLSVAIEPRVTAGAESAAPEDWSARPAPGRAWRTPAATD